MPDLLRAHPRLALLGLYLFFLLLVELALRLGWGDELLANPSPAVVPDALVHHDYRPGAVFTTTPFPGDTFAPVQNRINAFGIRGPEPQPKTRARVLLLGDSFVQADEVPYQQSFTHLLNEYFTDRIDFVSHGMVSWSPTPEFSWLHHKGLQLDPDAVVLFLCLNDFYRHQTFHQTDAAYRHQANYRGRVPVSYNLPEGSAAKSVLDNIALARLLHRGYRTLRLNISPPVPTDYTIPSEIIHLARPADTWPTDLRANVDATLQVVLDMHAYLKAKDIPLHATLVPSPFAWPEEVAIGKQHPLYGWDVDFAVSQAGLENHVRQVLEQNSIPFIDLYTPFKEAKSRDHTLLFNEVDGHWKASGHRLVFESLKDYLNSSF